MLNLTIDQWNERIWRPEGKLVLGEDGKPTSKLWEDLKNNQWTIRDGAMFTADGEEMFRSNSTLDLIGSLSVHFECLVLEELYGDC